MAVGQRSQLLLLGLLGVVGFVAPMDSLRVGALGGVADAFLILALGSLVLRVLKRQQIARLGPYAPVLLAASGLAVAGLIGTFWSPDPTLSLLNIARFSLAIGGLLVLFANLARSERAVRFLMWSYVLGVAMSALYSFLNVSPYTGRSAGLSFHPNALGLTCAFAMSLTFGLISTTHRGLGRRFGLLSFVILGFGVLNSGSRAALIAVLASAFVFLAASRSVRLLRYGAVAVVGAVLAIAMGLITLPESTALDRLFTTSELTSQSNDERALARAVTLERIDAHPIAGSGFANVTAAHNVPLQVYESGGVLGAIAACALVAAVLPLFWRRRRDPLVAGALAMYCGYLVAGLVSPPLWDRWLWFPIACGVALHARSLTSEGAGEPRPGPLVLRRGFDL